MFGKAKRELEAANTEAERVEKACDKHADALVRDTLARINHALAKKRESREGIRETSEWFSAHAVKAR